MDKFTVVVKSPDRVSGTTSNFKIKFSHVLPSECTIFKCRVTAFSLEHSTLFVVRNVNDVEVRALTLVGELPYINHHSTSRNSIPIVLINYSMQSQTYDFLVSNINHQTINFRYTDNIDVDIDPATIAETIFVLTFEKVII